LIARLAREISYSVTARTLSAEDIQGRAITRLKALSSIGQRLPVRMEAVEWLGRMS
jgi:hypothetical protein